MLHRTWPKIAACLIAGLYIAPAANSMQWPHGTAFLRPQPAPAALRADRDPEQAIVSALTAIRQNRLDDADKVVDALLQSMPNYRLAHLLKGDLLMARSQPLADIGAAPVADDKLADLRQEAAVRLLHYSAPPPTDHIPANLLQFGPGQRYAVVIDASRARIFLYRNDGGVPRYVRDFYATIGKLGVDKNRAGDQRTPLGIYFVTGHMAREELDRRYGSLAELYGVGAWPLSYPNDLDRREGRTGSGIWLHGVPYDTYSRAPKASNGCVALTNADMGALGEYLLPGTPVVIAERIEWLDRETWSRRRAGAQAEVEQWRRDWESLDTSRYLAHYASDFRSGNLDLAGWSSQKRSVGAGKQWSQVKLDQLSLFAYPTAQGSLLMADFEQDYRSNNLENRMKKRLYFKREAQDWRIVYEGTAS